LELQKKEAADSPLEENHRVEKRLARGLEDVSYLFLSPPSDKPAGKPDDSNASTGKVPPEPIPSRTPFLLCPSPAVNRELLLSLLNKSVSVLEEGMLTIDANIPCDPFGFIDLVAVDSLDQLSIINVDTVQKDESLLRGIAHFDWMTRNMPIVRRMYHGRAINYSVQPRLFLVAPGFSPLLKCVAQRSTDPRICCFAYRTAAMPGGVGILFERA
jgi:hypothetical protein